MQVSRKDATAVLVNVCGYDEDVVDLWEPEDVANRLRNLASAQLKDGAGVELDTAMKDLVAEILSAKKITVKADKKENDSREEAGPPPASGQETEDNAVPPASSTEETSHDEHPLGNGGQDVLAFEQPGGQDEPKKKKKKAPKTAKAKGNEEMPAVATKPKKARKAQDAEKPERKFRKDQRKSPVAVGKSLTRSYDGKEHTITSTTEGIEYRGHLYPSLTTIAKKITGHKNISGPLFFGVWKLKKK